MNWNKIVDGKPKSGEHVLLVCSVREGRRYICDGFYTGAYETEVSFLGAEDYPCEYRGDRDAYYLTEGFYEVIKNGNFCNCVEIEDEVTHWGKMPELPKEDA